jgi:uncharacterized membrane protein
VKLLLLWTFAILMMAAGLNHIIFPKFYRTFIPNWLPLFTVNYAVGIIEFLIGLGLFFPQYRHGCALALLIMMLSFLPFHLLDVFKENPAIGSKLLAYIRLPLQFVLIWWAWYLLNGYR